MKAGEGRAVAGAAHLAQGLLLAAAVALVLLLVAWGALALWFQAPGGTFTRGVIVAAWCVLEAAFLFHGRSHPGSASLGFALVFLALLVWWHGLRPTNTRDWADDVARTGYGVVAGDTVTLHEVRNFEWRSADDYTVRWETRSYDLRALSSLDLINSYWAGPAIAHTLVSFGFNDGSHLVFSVEIRRARGEAFSSVGGFFKEFELSVIAADERDIVRVRTNVRGEDDYLYRIRLPLRDIRALFVAYVAQMNLLVNTPRFYNTLTVNCTLLVFHMLERTVGHLPFSYRLLLSGYLPEYVYAVGGLDMRYSLAQLRSFGRITARARAADNSADFSAAIRRGIPPLPPAPP